MLDFSRKKGGGRGCKTLQMPCHSFSLKSTNLSFQSDSENERDGRGGGGGVGGRGAVSLKLHVEKTVLSIITEPV